MNPLSAVYGRVAGLRREWYARHPEKQQRLPVPVISVGNLVVGGSGKTPIVAALAQQLRAMGERPAVLSRGYRRRSRSDAVIVVSDGSRVLASVQESGDEPQMLAGILEGVPVVVSARRYRAGVAAQRFEPTVMLLDDGFQHFALARDVDLLVIAPSDLEEQVLPGGALREPLSAGRIADAVIVRGTLREARQVADAVGVARAFVAETRYEALQSLAGAEAPAHVERRVQGGPPYSGRRAVAVAGIARPERFFDALTALGWTVVSRHTFADHHWFEARDVQRIEQDAKEHGAAVIITTEKDAVRLAGLPLSTSWASLPLRVSIAPPTEFTAWLRERLDSARTTLERRSDAAEGQ